MDIYYGNDVHISKIAKYVHFFPRAKSKGCYVETFAIPFFL